MILHPDFARNGVIYLSFVGSDNGGKTRGAEVVRAKLTLSPKPNLTNVTPIWKQTPKVRGKGHFSHRLAFDKSGKLFITSGDRQMMDPAQDWNSSLGKVIRINADGSVPNDNPFQDKGELAKTFWSVGHRNPLGIAFDANGRLWSTEMGPRCGDELNLLLPGRNYGWPLVSLGLNYDGSAINYGEWLDITFELNDIEQPVVDLTPAPAVSSFIFYEGEQFPRWRGNALVGSLKGSELYRIILDENDRYVHSEVLIKQLARIRDIETGPGGNVYLLLEHAKGGKIVRLVPVNK